jgi:hypothetical protein
MESGEMGGWGEGRVWGVWGKALPQKGLRGGEVFFGAKG